MAFKKASEADAAKAAELMAQMSGQILRNHQANTAALIAADPSDTTAVLRAIKVWRGAQEQRQRYWRAAAAFLLGIEGDPERVCAELGMGRTALENAIRTDKILTQSFAQLLTSNEEEN